MAIAESEARFNSVVCETNFMPAIRIKNVFGFDERCNDVLYCPPLTEEGCYAEISSTQQGIVVFFGGDMQDFHENMISKEKTKKFAEWSLENIAKLLSMNYKNCHIVIIRPFSIEDGIFSKFSNFVPSLNYGDPNYISNYSSLQHLRLLLANLQDALKNSDFSDIKNRLEHTCELLESKLCRVPGKEEYSKDFSGSYIELVAFSKGCVVLNQFLHEFHHFKKADTEKPEEVIDLMDKIKTIRWLDGGHNGRQGTWITSEEILASYADMGKRTFVHVTPYQVICSKRPWIGKEEQIFSRTLAERGVEIERKLHMEHSKGTLEDHFKLLKEVFPDMS